MIESFILFLYSFSRNLCVVSYAIVYAVVYAVTYAVSYAVFYQIMNMKYLLCRANHQISLRVAVTGGKEKLMKLIIIQ